MFIVMRVWLIKFIYVDAIDILSTFRTDIRQSTISRTNKNRSLFMILSLVQVDFISLFAASPPIAQQAIVKPISVLAKCPMEA